MEELDRLSAHHNVVGHLEARDAARDVANVLKSLEIRGEHIRIGLRVPCLHSVRSTVERLLLWDVHRRVTREVPAQLGRRRLLRADDHEGWEARAAVGMRVTAVAAARERPCRHSG